MFHAPHAESEREYMEVFDREIINHIFTLRVYYSTGWSVCQVVLTGLFYRRKETYGVWWHV